MSNTLRQNLGLCVWATGAAGCKQIQAGTTTNDHQRMTLELHNSSMRESLSRRDTRNPQVVTAGAEARLDRCPSAARVAVIERLEHRGRRGSCSRPTPSAVELPLKSNTKPTIPVQCLKQQTWYMTRKRQCVTRCFKQAACEPTKNTPTPTSKERHDELTICLLFSKGLRITLRVRTVTCPSDILY